MDILSELIRAVTSIGGYVYQEPTGKYVIGVPEDKLSYFLSQYKAWLDSLGVPYEIKAIKPIYFMK